MPTAGEVTGPLVQFYNTKCHEFWLISCFTRVNNLGALFKGKYVSCLLWNIKCIQLGFRNFAETFSNRNTLSTPVETCLRLFRLQVGNNVITIRWHSPNDHVNTPNKNMTGMLLMISYIRKVHARQKLEYCNLHQAKHDNNLFEKLV